MDYLSSSSIAGLVLMIGGSCALVSPEARGGDRIEFSAPAIPLAIPQPEVEIKEPQKPISAASPAEGPTYDADYFPPQEFTTTRTRSKEKDPWNSSPFQDDTDPRAADDLFTARLEQNRLTNGSLFSLRHAWDADNTQLMPLRKGDAKDSKLGDDPNASRFGLRNGWDKSNGRDGEMFGRDNATKKNESSLLKLFSLDPTAPDRVSAWQPRSFLGQAESLTGAGSEDLKFKLGLPSDSAHLPALPPGYGSYDPADKRQTDQQAGPTAGYMRAWEPADSRPAAPKRFADPNHPDLSHVVAPIRPVNLQMPKKPSDPNPY